MITMMAIPRHSLYLPEVSNEIIFARDISERRPKREGFACVLLFRIRGLFIFWGRRKGWKKRGTTKPGGASWRELPEKDKLLSCCATDQVPGGGRDMEGGGSLGKVWVKRRTGRLAYFNENGFRIYANRFFFFHPETMYFLRY